MGDALTRFSNLKGHECILSTGTDEHGLKIQESAKKMNMSELQFCEKNSSSFKHLFDISNINYQKFTRTTDQKHKDTVIDFWLRLSKSGMIYKGLHRGWYCVSDETFIPESMVEKVGDVHMSKETGKPVVWTEEENYKFKLSDMQPKILSWLKNNPEIIVPKYQYYAALNQLKEPMADISISRLKSRVSWGIDVPGDKNHVIYVWLDALVNYLTCINYPEQLNPQTLMIHVIGKDILK